MCVVGLRYFVARVFITLPYSPLARQILALRGKQSLPPPENPKESQRMKPKKSDDKVRARPRREVPPIKVWVSDLEKETIAERAEQTGLSMSAFLLATGLNTPIKSRVDLLAVADLAKVNGDLGRTAGLLKLWLSEKRGQGAKPVDVESLMIEFRELQSLIREKMSSIVYARSM